MMVRLSVSKREKGRRKRANVMSSQLHSLTHFSDISALTGGTPHLNEVRCWSSGGRWPSCFQLTVCGLITTRNLERDTNIESAQPFLPFSVHLQDQNPTKKRKKIPKKGRKKKGEWMAQTWVIKCSVGFINWDTGSGFAILVLTNLYSVSSILGIYLFRCGPYFFLFQDENQYHSQKRLLDSVSEIPIAPVQACLRKYKSIPWRNCYPVSVSFLLPVFHPGRIQSTATGTHS